MSCVTLTGALLALASLQAALSLKLAAFNIRSFGETKISNATLSKNIVQVSSPRGPAWQLGGKSGLTPHPPLDPESL